VRILPLNTHHIDIFLVRPETINQQLQTEFELIIADSEKDSIARKRTDIAQRDALITRALVRLALSKYVNVPPTGWQFDKGFNGKPHIAKACQGYFENIEFNLSHATGLIACAVTKSLPLGVDVEYTKRKSDTYKLAPRYFSQAENDDLQALPHAQQAISFYDYWTLKESYIKACGDGLAIPLNHFSFDLNDRNNITISFDDARDDHPKNWHCALFDVTDDHKMALTARVKQTNITTNIYLMNEEGEFNLTSLPLK